MNIAYVRVSTIEQNPGRQYEDLKKFNIDKWYEEKASAKNTDRPVVNVLPPIEAGASCFNENSATDSKELRRLTLSPQA